MRELRSALAIVRDAARAASSLQRRIAESGRAVAKPDRDGTGFGVSPVTVADFMVQALILGSLAKAFPSDRFIAEETSADLVSAGPATRAAVMAALGENGGLHSVMTKPGFFNIIYSLFYLGLSCLVRMHAGPHSIVVLSSLARSTISLGSLPRISSLRCASASRPSGQRSCSRSCSAYPTYGCTRSGGCTRG